MLGVLVALVLLVLILVVPIMIGARMVGAEKTGFGTAVVAVILSVAVGAGIQMLGMNPFIAFVISAIVGAFLLAALLGTTFWRGMAVSVVAAVIQGIAFVVFLGGVLAVAS